MSEKAKYWTAVCYPENMRDDWQVMCEDIIGFPFAYCIHDKDKLQCKSDIIEHDERKVHVHFLIAWNNTTTEKTVYNLVNKLSKLDRVCCPKVFQVMNVRSMFDYLIHDTKTCQKLGKHLYDVNERVCGNNFDIGTYEQISLEEKEQMANALTELILDMDITNFTLFQRLALENYPNDKKLVQTVIRGNSGYYDRLVRGNYYLERERVERERKSENTVDAMEIIRLLTRNQ